MTRKVLNLIGGIVCFPASILLLAAWTDTDGASRAAWFWWLKAAALALCALSFHLLRAAQRPREKDDKHS